MTDKDMDNKNLIEDQAYTFGDIRILPVEIDGIKSLKIQVDNVLIILPQSSNHIIVHNKERGPKRTK